MTVPHSIIAETDRRRIVIVDGEDLFRKSFGLNLLYERFTATVRGDVRFFRFNATEKHEQKVEDLDLPEDTYVAAISGEEESRIAPPGTRIKAGEEVLLVTVSDRVNELAERFGGARNNDDESRKDNKNKEALRAPLFQ